MLAEANALINPEMEVTPQLTNTQANTTVPPRLKHLLTRELKVVCPQGVPLEDILKTKNSLFHILLMEAEEVLVIVDILPPQLAPSLRVGANPKQ